MKGLGRAFSNEVHILSTQFYFIDMDEGLIYIE